MKFDYTLYPGRKLNKKTEYINQENAIISIITPYYNSKQYIETTAKSVLNQTFPFFEWIIIDDGSTDKESLEKLIQIEKMDNRIKVYHKENEGLAATRDFGAAKASNTSKYLVFLDDDDAIDETFLECGYWTLETNIEASWAYTDVVNFGGEEYLWRKMFDSEVEKKENLLTATAVIRKQDFQEVGGYELREKSVFEDWNFWLKLLSKNKFPVRMSFLGFWYRRKPKNESELVRAKNNKKTAMKYVNETAKKIKEEIEAIQYPKQDYDWDEIVDSVPQMVIPKKKKDDKIKILMILPWMVVGGADKFNLDIISKSDNNKFEFIIITTMPSDNIWKQKFQEHATIYDLPSFLDRKYWISFINYIIEKNNINIIFNSNSTFGYASIPYLKVNHPEIPIIDYIHMEEWYWRNGGYSRDSAMVSNFIDTTCLCNKNSAMLLAEHFGVKQEKIKTCYIGVDENKFNPLNYNKEKILDKLNIKADGKYVLGYICRITEQKRPHLMLRCIKALREKRNDFIVVIAGDGPMFKEIKNTAKSLKIDDVIFFLGNISKTEEIYAICDLTLNCSIKEGLALTSYESLSMGAPVISSDVGGQKELINEEVGVIVPCLQDETDIKEYNYSKEEIYSYVDGIEKILNNLNKYKSKCRERILNGFTIDNMVKNMEEFIYQTSRNPNINITQHAKNCDKKIVKELITYHLIAFSAEYEWLCSEFNKKNVHILKQNVKELRGKLNPMYEYTLEYKIKHPIVVCLKKVGIYDYLKKLFRIGDD